MTKKRKLIMLVSISFLCTVFIFTAIFLSVLKPNLPMNAFSAEDVGSATQSSYAVLSGSDVGSVILIVAFIGGFIYIVLKS